MMGEVRARLGCAALALTLLLNLFPASVRAGSTQSCPQGALCSHEAAIGTTHYDTLEEAVAAAVSGQIITLQTNVELEAQLDLPDGVTLDGRGRKISAASDTWSSNNQSKYMLVGRGRVTIQDVTLDGAGVAAGCLQFYKAQEGSLQGLVTLKNAQGLGLAINASQVAAEGVLTLKGNGWGDIINVGWGSQLSGMDRCSFDASAAALDGVAAVYTDHSDVRNAGGDVGKFSIRLPASFASATEGELAALGKAILYAPAAAEVEGTGYLSLAGAFQAARDGSTITLRSSSAGNRTLTLSDGRKLTLDLNGFDVGFAQGQTLRVSQGELILTGRGKLYEQQPQTAPVTLLGSDDPDAENHTSLTVDKDVTLSGWSGVWIGPGEGGQHAFGVTAVLSGTLVSSTPEGGHAVHLSETVTDEEGNVPRLHLEGATLTASGGTGLYLGGYAQTTVSGSDIRAESGTGVVLSAGELTIQGNTVVSGGTGPLAAIPGGDGSDTSHVALAVVQHLNKLPVALTITGGIFTGGGALLEQNAHNGDPEASSKVELNVSGGRFHGQIYTENQIGFITGGTFTAHPGLCLAEGFAAEDSGDAVYHYIVTAAGENPAQVVAGEAEVSVSDTVSGGEEQALAQQVVQALTDPHQGGREQPDIGEALRAAASTVANQNPVTQEQGKQALDTAGIPSGDVTIVVRPYLEIAVAEVSVQSGEQSITLDITPMYITVAATDPDDIQLKDGTKNAVAMGQPQTLTITKPVTITLPLTDGFAENGRLYVKHEKNSGAVYYYRGAVADNVLTFINPNGFSRFSYSTASEVVADINGQGYSSLEAAVAAVEEGGTIEVLTPGLSAQVGRVIRFTVTGAGADSVQLTAGPGYEKKQAGNTYTFAYVGQSPGGPGLYPIVANPAEHGSVTVQPGQAWEGAAVTVITAPDKGYVLDQLIVTDENGDALALMDLGGGKYTFYMPASAAAVTAVFVPAQQSKLPFLDVKEGSWYYEGVKFVYDQGLMTGIQSNRFGVDDTTTRAMIWTVLAAYNGQNTSGGSPWYAPSQQWVITNGISDGTHPNSSITREQLAVMLWRAAGSPSAGSLSGYTDADQVSSWAQTAVAWAVEEGILSGMEAGVLAPHGQATRAQTAVMLMQFVHSMLT